MLRRRARTRGEGATGEAGDEGGAGGGRGSNLGIVISEAGGTGVARVKEIVVQQEFREKVEDREAMMFLTSF